MAKKTKRSRSSRIAIAAMYGEEPTFADFDDLSEKEKEARYSDAMYWYHGVYSTKACKDFFLDYVKKNRKKDLAAVKSVWFSSAWGHVAHAIDNGYKCDKLIAKLNVYIDGLLEEGKKILADKKKVEKKKADDDFDY